MAPDLCSLSHIAGMFVSLESRSPDLLFLQPGLAPGGRHSRCTGVALTLLSSDVTPADGSFLCPLLLHLPSQGDESGTPPIDQPQLAARGRSERPELG